MILNLIFAFVATWILWKLAQIFVLGSPLDNIPGPPAGSFVGGNIFQLFDDNAAGFHKELLTKYGGVIKYKGLLGENGLLVSDPRALHYIVVKDEDIYEETPELILGSRIVFGPGLLSVLGDDHRRQRKMLTPAFSTAHMREMIPIFYDVAYKFRDLIASKTEDGPQEIELLSWLSRIALELIGQGGFGFSFDPLTEGSVPHPYAISAKQFVPAFMKLSLFQHFLLPTLSEFGTPRFWRFVMDLVPWKALHEFRDITDTMYDTSVEVFESKKKALAEGDEALKRQIVGGKDIMSILLRANTRAAKENRLSEDELIAQLSTLSLAALDTTSSALSRIFFVLAERPDVQDRLRAEIRGARNGQVDLSYDQLDKLPYLDAICKETLRLYPPVPLVRRSVRQDVVLPLSTPIKGRNGAEISQIHIPKRTNMFLSIVNCNQSPEIWGVDSYEWKAERWLNPLPESVAAARVPGVYSNTMSFLGGGRACIGFKFAQLEMKVVLSVLIESFKFSLPQKDIFWKMGGVQTPAIVGEKSKSQLPLIVEHLPKNYAFS